MGLVIDVGVFTGNKDVKVLWNSNRGADHCQRINTYKSEHLEVINEDR